MANHFSLYATLLLLFTSSALMVMVASDGCKQENGDCTAAFGKTCTEDFLLSDNCEDTKCTLACISKHPRRKAQGRCQL
ncbi:hypothetical protein HN51_004640, partial [Arachis hypogaea]